MKKREPTTQEEMEEMRIERNAAKAVATSITSVIISLLTLAINVAILLMNI